MAGEGGGGCGRQGAAGLARGDDREKVVVGGPLHVRQLVLELIDGVAGDARDGVHGLAERVVQITHHRLARGLGAGLEPLDLVARPLLSADVVVHILVELRVAPLGSLVLAQEDDGGDEQRQAGHAQEGDGDADADSRAASRRHGNTPRRSPGPSKPGSDVLLGVHLRAVRRAPAIRDARQFRAGSAPREPCPYAGPPAGDAASPPRSLASVADPGPGVKLAGSW